MSEKVRITVHAECGEKTCAAEPGKFCRFVRNAQARPFGRMVEVCNLYEAVLRDEDGWLMRCDECLAEQEKKDE